MQAIDNTRGEYLTTEKIAEGTTLDQLKIALSGLTKAECLATALKVTANDNNAGMIRLCPADWRDTVEVYRDNVAPYNATYASMSWQLVYNRSADSISYTQATLAINGAFASSNPTVSSWELYRYKVQ